MEGKKLNYTTAAFVYREYELDPDDFEFRRMTADNLVVWCISRQKEVVLRR